MEEKIGSLKAMDTLYYVLIGWAIIQSISTLSNFLKCSNFLINPYFWITLGIIYGFIITVVRFAMGVSLALRCPTVEGGKLVNEWLSFIVQGLGFLLASYFVNTINIFSLLFVLAIFVDMAWLYKSFEGQVEGKHNQYKPMLITNRIVYICLLLVCWFILLAALIWLEIFAFIGLFVSFFFFLFASIDYYRLFNILKFPQPNKINNANLLERELQQCYFQWLWSDFVILPSYILVAFIALSLEYFKCTDFFLLMPLAFFVCISIWAKNQDYKHGENLYVGSYK